MPIYAYRCESCGHAQDVLQKISDPLLTVCPACGSGSFRKQLTAAGFQLKGSGWYATDFRNGPKSSGGAESPKPDAGGASADSGVSTTTSAPAKNSSSGTGAGVSTSAASACGTSCACH